MTDWLVVAKEPAFFPDEQQVLLGLPFVLLQYEGAQGPAQAKQVLSNPFYSFIHSFYFILF